MKKLFLICSLVFAAAAAVAAQSQTYKIFDGKKVVSEQGLVGLYESEGKIYLEIPRSLLGQRLLTGTSVEECSDMLESNVGYQPIAPYIVVFEKNHSSILMRRLNESYVDKDGGNILDSNISSVEKVFSIKEFSSDSTAYLVDATSFFLSHDKTVDPIDPKAFNAAGGFVKRTGTHVSSSTIFAGFDSSEDAFRVSVCNTYKIKAAFLGVYASDEMTLVNSVVRRNFMLLPQDKMIPVENDAKVGTYSVSLEDYDHSKPKSSLRSYASKWRMTVGPEGNVTDPVCFYVDSSFPELWKKYICESVEEWNRAFDAIGFKSALVAQVMPSEDSGFDPSDIRYNCIRYNLSPSENIRDSKWCDPSTGEILGAGIVVNHGVAECIKKNLILQTSAGCSAARSLTVDSLLFGKALKAMMLRHVGHCLGLADNMAGSFAYPVDSLSNAGFTRRNGISSSVMDELPFNFVAFSSENVDEGTVMIQDRLGDYDIYALSCLYGGISADCKNKFYGKRQKPTDFYDPRSMSFDLGNDAVKSVEKGFEGLASTLSGLNEWIADSDPDFNFRQGLQEAVVLQAYEYIKQVFVNVGGIYVSPKSAGDSCPTYESVPKSIQREHLLWALNFIDDLSFLDNDALKADCPLRGDTGEFCQKYFTNFIFIQLDAMWLSEIRSEDPYTQQEALHDVSEHIWKGAAKGEEPTDLQKFQRETFLENLISWAGVRGNYYFREANTKRELSRPDKTHLWYGHLMEMKKLLKTACSKVESPDALRCYRYLLYKVEKYL